MVRSRCLAPLLSLLVVFSSVVPPVAEAQASCQFVLGFATLRNLVGAATVGDCLEDQQTNVENGDAYQRTTGGMLVWRKADNWTAFTNGHETWLNGPNGLARRLNTQRFAWEGDVGTPGTTLVSEGTQVPQPVNRSEQARRAYREKLTLLLDMYVQGDQRFTQLGNAPRLTDRAWIAAVADAVGTMNVAAQEIASIQPVPPEYARTAELYRAFAAEQQAFTDLYIAGIDRRDPSLLALAEVRQDRIGQLSAQIEAELARVVSRTAVAPPTPTRTPVPRAPTPTRIPPTVTPTQTPPTPTPTLLPDQLPVSYSGTASQRTATFSLAGGRRHDAPTAPYKLQWTARAQNGDVYCILDVQLLRADGAPSGLHRYELWRPVHGHEGTVTHTLQLAASSMSSGLWYFEVQSAPGIPSCSWSLTLTR